MKKEGSKIQFNACGAQAAPAVPQGIKVQRPKPTVKRTRVAIVGCSDSKDLAPFDDQSWEFWGVNNLYLSLPAKKFTRWFEIHEITKHENNLFKRRGNFDFRGQPVNQYLSQLAAFSDELNIPIYMRQHWPEIPKSIPYPLQSILANFRPYFTNTVSWMIALAIFEGFKEIGIWGVDMAVGSEYNHQRPSCEYFIGIAEGRGIKVTIPDEADLLKTRFLYAFQEKEEDAFNRKVAKMKQSMEGRLQKAQARKNQAFMEEQQYMGAITSANEIQKIWENEIGGKYR